MGRCKQKGFFVPRIFPKFNTVFLVMKVYYFLASWLRLWSEALEPNKSIIIVVVTRIPIKWHWWLNEYVSTKEKTLHSHHPYRVHQNRPGSWFQSPLPANLACINLRIFQLKPHISKASYCIIPRPPSFFLSPPLFFPFSNSILGAVANQFEGLNKYWQRIRPPLPLLLWMARAAAAGIARPRTAAPI